MSRRPLSDLGTGEARHMNLVHKMTVVSTIIMPLEAVLRANIVFTLRGNNGVHVFG